MKEKILDLRKEGKSYSEISNILKCSKATISYHLSESVRENYRIARRRNRYKQRRELKIKHGGKCSICGYDKCLDALDFHHKDPSNKIESVSHLFYLKSKKSAHQEAEKCILICRNCHAELHADEFDKLRNVA